MNIIGFADGKPIIPGEATPWDDEERKPLEDTFATPLPYEWAENGEAALPSQISLRRWVTCFEGGFDEWFCRMRSDTRNRSKKQMENWIRRARQDAEYCRQLLLSSNGNGTNGNWGD